LSRVRAGGGASPGTGPPRRGPMRRLTWASAERSM
jgi:hypothetical protein